MSHFLPVLLAATTRKRHDSDATSQCSDRPTRRPGLDKILAILSVVIMIVAFVLAMLCLFAGDKPHVAFMEPYAIFTLNVSRIGENLKDELDDKIASIDFSSIQLKRSIPMSSVDAPIAMVTAPPTTFIRVRSPLDIGSIVHEGTSIVDSAVKSGASDVKSAATQVPGEAVNGLRKGLTDVQSVVIKLVNEAYEGIIDGLNLEDFYSLHLLTTCYGHYVTSNGTNITVGGSVFPDNGTHKYVERCKGHSAIDPVQLVKIVYIVGIVLIGLALLASALGIFKGHLGYSILNILVTGTALSIVGVATGVTHGVAFGAAKLINFVGGSVGVAGEVGHWVTLSWTVVFLLLVDCLLWFVIGWYRHRQKKKMLNGAIEMAGYSNRAR